MESYQADANCQENTASILHDLETADSASGDQFAYKDLPQGLMEAEERRRQSLESSALGISLNVESCFEKPEPVMRNYTHREQKERKNSTSSHAKYWLYFGIYIWRFIKKRLILT